MSNARNTQGNIARERVVKQARRSGINTTSTPAEFPPSPPPSQELAVLIGDLSPPRKHKPRVGWKPDQPALDPILPKLVPQRSGWPAFSLTRTEVEKYTVEEVKALEQRFREGLQEISQSRREARTRLPAYQPTPAATSKTGTAAHNTPKKRTQGSGGSEHIVDQQLEAGQPLPYPEYTAPVVARRIDAISPDERVARVNTIGSGTEMVQRSGRLASPPIREVPVAFRHLDFWGGPERELRRFQSYDFLFEEYRIPSNPAISSVVNMLLSDLLRRIDDDHVIFRLADKYFWQKTYSEIAMSVGLEMDFYRINKPLRACWLSTLAKVY